MAIARRLSDLDEKQWQQQRREKMWEVKQQITEGEFLAKQRDRGKRKFEDMSATEQQVLEDFDTQKSKTVRAGTFRETTIFPWYDAASLSDSVTLLQSMCLCA